ncbi:MAG: heme-binding protein [Rhodospirillales bacterium]|nr:heme-binding protein [Rhodospirillales bacterium]MDE2319843.1 heme-binding protein [Rhodospirillales bacterium]
MSLTLEAAQKIVAGVLAYAKAQNLKPLAVGVFDPRGAIKAFAAQDGTSLKRGEIALGKANGALALGVGSRALMKRAELQPSFISAVGVAIGGGLIPVPGGVLIKQAGVVIGAVGVSGDTSDNDEAAAVAGITDAGLVAEGG